MTVVLRRTVLCSGLDDSGNPLLDIDIDLRAGKQRQNLTISLRFGYTNTGMIRLGLAPVLDGEAQKRLSPQTPDAWMALDNTYPMAALAWPATPIPQSFRSESKVRVIVAKREGAPLAVWRDKSIDSRRNRKRANDNYRYDHAQHAPAIALVTQQN